MQMMINRTCTCCRKAKPLSQFYTKNGRPMARCKMCDSRIKQHDRSKEQQQARVNQLRKELKDLAPKVGEEFEVRAEPFESSATLEHTTRQALLMCGMKAEITPLTHRRLLKIRII